jgi:hypothetical protein
MRRLFAILSLLVLTIFCFNGCAASGANFSPQVPDLSQQAQVDLHQSVALVTDIGPRDRHHLFCSGTWIGPDHILTATHCVKGYVQMKHRNAVIQALQAAGCPEELAIILSGIDLSELDPNDPDLPPGAADFIRIVQSVPYEPTLGQDVPYIVPSQVRDVGAAPSGYQHTVAVFLDVRADVALLETRGFVPEHAIAALADQTPAVGDNVTLVGSIRGNFFSFRTENVSAYRHTEKYDGMDQVDGPFMQLAGALITHGDSGSGIFNAAGQLVGMTSFISEDSQLTYCIHLDTIRSMMIGHRLIKAKLDSNPNTKDPDLSDTPLNLE